MHQVYPEINISEKIAASILLTEDSNAGYEMFQAVCKNIKITCNSANGKSNVAKYILTHKDQQIFAVVDGAAFGADMQSLMHALKVNPKSHVWAPESFEYLILQSGIIQAKGIKEILDDPGNYIESSEYHSWERFFTWLLEDFTKNTIYAYSKKKLNPNYLTKGNLQKMEKIMPAGLFPPTVQK